MEIYDLAIKFIKDVGFPIFVSVYLIVKFEKTLNQLRDSIQENSNLIKILVEKLLNDKEDNKEKKG